MTYSIGMRAPSHRDLLAGLFQTPTDWFSKSLVEYQDEDRLYRDPRRKPTREPGLIDPDVIASITQLALQQIKDSDFMARFTLKHLTLSAQAPEGFSKPTTAALARLMAQLKNPTTRLIRTHIMPLAYVPLHTNTLALGIGGTLIELPLKLQSLLAKITQSSALSGPELLEMVPKPLDSSLGRTGIDLVYNLIQWRILEVSRMKQKD